MSLTTPADQPISPLQYRIKEAHGKKVTMRYREGLTRST